MKQWTDPDLLQVVGITPVSLLRAEAAGVSQKLSNHHLVANGAALPRGAARADSQTAGCLL